MRNIVTFFSIFLVFSDPLFAKVRVLTFHYNQADFVEMQYKCMRKFLRDDSELIVFNDASTVENEQDIQDICDKVGVQCVRYKPEWHSADPLNNNPLASFRHARAIQYALDHFGYDHNDSVIIMDGDAFFIRPISVRERLQDLDIFGAARGDVGGKIVNYFWPPFIAFDPSKLPNRTDLKFNPSIIDDYWHDTGAESYHYLKNNPTVRYMRQYPEVTAMFSHIPQSELMSMGFNQAEIDLIRNLHILGCQVELHMDRCVLHFREVSFELGKHYEKLECLYKFMNKLLSK
jgi:hypothetical protein